MPNDNDRENKETEVTAGSTEQDAKLAARRRLLLAGAKVVPVVAATLASRPSLACHCVMPSAWGSVNVALGGADVDMGQNGLANRLTGSMARYGGVIRSDFSPYYLSAWTSSDDTAWQALANRYPGFPTGLPASKKIKYLKGLYSSPTIHVLTVGALCAVIGFTPPAGANNAQALATIQAGGFKAAILVAEFNVHLGKIPSDCLSKGRLNEMASGYYLPSGVSATDAWTSSNGQIADYLHFNWIARRA